MVVRQDLRDWELRIRQSLDFMGSSPWHDRVAIQTWIEALMAAFAALEANPDKLDAMSLALRTAGPFDPIGPMFKDMLLKFAATSDVWKEVGVDFTPVQEFTNDWLQRVMYDPQHRRTFIEWFSQNGLNKDGRIEFKWVNRGDKESRYKSPRFNPFINVDEELLELGKWGKEFNRRHINLLNKMDPLTRQYIQVRELAFLIDISSVLPNPRAYAEDAADKNRRLPPEYVPDEMLAINRFIVHVLTVMKALGEWLLRKWVESDVYKEYMSAQFPRRSSLISEFLFELNTQNNLAVNAAVNSIHSVKQLLLLSLQSVGGSFQGFKNDIVYTPIYIGKHLTRDQVREILMLDFASEQLYVQKDPISKNGDFDLWKNSFRTLMAQCRKETENVIQHVLRLGVKSASELKFLQNTLAYISGSGQVSIGELVLRCSDSSDVTVGLYAGISEEDRQQMIVYNHVLEMARVDYGMNFYDFSNTAALTLFGDYELETRKSALKSDVDSFQSTKCINDVSKLIFVGLFESVSAESDVGSFDRTKSVNDLSKLIFIDWDDELDINDVLSGYPYYESVSQNQEELWDKHRKGLLAKNSSYVPRKKTGKRPRNSHNT